MPTIDCKKIWTEHPLGLLLAALKPIRPKRVAAILVFPACSLAVHWASARKPTSSSLVFILTRAGAFPWDRNPTPRKTQKQSWAQSVRSEDRNKLFNNYIQRLAIYCISSLSGENHITPFWRFLIFFHKSMLLNTLYVCVKLWTYWTYRKYQKALGREPLNSIWS